MVSQRRLKRPVSALVALVFLSSLLITLVFEVYTTVSASTPIKPVILELTDMVESGKQADYNHVAASQLGSTITSTYDVVTMTMKEFNASREELLGKYDAIVFGPSRAKDGFEYAQKQSVPPANKDAAHDTSAYENDITQLKIDQIKSSLLNNGIPVFLHNDTIAQERNFKKFDPTTVTFYTTQQEIETELADFFTVRKMNRISNVKLTQDGKTLTSLVDIESTNVVPAVRGKAIDFTYSLAETPSNQAKVELYLDFDSNDRFTSQELISTSDAVKDGKLSYTIDVPSFTSPRFWKLIVKDPVNQSYTYTTGRFLLKDQTAKAKVLQITADNSGTNRTGSLQSTFPNGQMLSKDDLYQFELEVINFKTFRDRMCPSGAVTQANKDWFFDKDLIIFGFKDSYINGIEIDCASSYLTQYMDEGRGVMFTHDMLYRLKGSNNFGNDASSVRSWERLYAKRFATDNFTNMGINAPLTTNQVKQAAKGLFTEYPYRLDEKPTKNTSNVVGNMIATTHNQYFALDLNNEDLTVWYNLVDRETSSKRYRTVGDSANHYYMYTVGNLTYSGAGHTQTFTNQVEKEIFVNTMFRAFIGSNHAPEIKLHSPTLTNDQATISDIEPLYVSWESLDYDFKDRFLDTKVTINGKQVYPKDTSSGYARVDNGKRVGFYYDHGIKGSGTLNVQIETKDQGGATARKAFTVNVKPSTDVAFVSRTIAPLVSEVGTDVAMTYDVKTQLPELNETSKAAYDDYTWKVVVKETIPSGYDVKTLPSGWSKDSTGKVITATYCKQLVKGNEVTPPAGCTSIPATPPKVILTAKQEGDFTFSQGEYSYNFVGKDQVGPGETPLSDLKQDGKKALNVVSTRVLPAELQSIQLTGPVYLSLGESKQLIPTFTPNTTKKLDLRWTISSDSSELLPSYIDNSATVHGLKTGTSTVRVSYTSPITGRTVTSNAIDVIVDDPPLGFTANNLNVFVSQDGTITPRIVTSNSRYRAFTFEVVEGREFIESVTTTTTALTVRGKAKGTARIKVSLVNQPLNQTIEPIFVNVNVALPVLGMTPSEETLWVYKNKDGQLVQQEVNLALTQTSPIKLPVTWLVPSTVDAVTIRNGSTSGVTVKAVKGMYPNDQKVSISAILSNFTNERVQSFITVREYPQEVIAPNVELYMENSPFVYQPDFWPMTSNVRGYGLQVAEGADVVQVIDDTKLVLKKPGVARVRIATEDVSRFFPNGNGPEVVYRDFLIRVRAGDDPNPETPNPDVGDYY